MKTNKPAFWVPTLYLAEGIPYTAVMILSLIFYKVEGLSNTDIALYTGWFYLPWLIKPLWSPVVEMLRTSKFWIVTCQILLGAALGSVGLTLPFDNWLTYTIILFWLAAFLSATHDIAADGFYIEALDDKQQAAWVGMRSTFYKIAMMLCQGALVILAGILEKKYNVQFAWTITFAILGVLMALFGVYHIFMLPKTAKAEAATASPNTPTNLSGVFESFWQQLKAFCLKNNILIILGLLLLYRLGEAQLSKMAIPFLMDSPDNGGLGFDTDTIGTISGMVMVACADPDGTITLKSSWNTNIPHPIKVGGNLFNRPARKCRIVSSTLAFCSTTMEAFASPIIRQGKSMSLQPFSKCSQISPGRRPPTAPPMIPTSRKIPASSST